jgi:hypothetical protein
MGLLENILEAGKRFLNDIHVSRSVECQLKMTNVQGDQGPAKRQKILKKNRELIQEDRRRIIHELANTVGISYGVCQEILIENLIMCRIAAKFVSPTTTRPPTRP